MNPTARRISEVRAREWREFGLRSRVAASSLRHDSAKLVEKHPTAAVAAAALVGIAALMFLRRRPAAKPCAASESARADRERRAPAPSAHGIFSEVFSKAVGAWLVSKFSAQEPMQPS